MARGGVGYSHDSSRLHLEKSYDSFTVLVQWLFLVPIKGGIGSIVHPPIGRKNTYHLGLPLIVLAVVWGLKNATDLQGGPLPVISGVISPINGLING